MHYYALVFLVFALIAGFLGFGGIAGTSAGIAKILFIVFIVGRIISVLANAVRGKSLQYGVFHENVSNFDLQSDFPGALRYSCGG